MKTLATIIAAGVLLATTSVVNAAPIYGQIKLSPTAGNTATVTHDGSTASFVDFANNTATGIQVISATGSFAGVAGTGSIADIALAPFAAIDPLWSLGGFSFALNTISTNAVLSAGGITFVALGGTGVISGVGFDDTLGSWSLSLDTTGGTFNWSSTVPEPASLALMGLGLLGLGAAGRRRRS